MTVLKNRRHERFAQEMASGASQQEAYVRAGYRAHGGNPSALAKDERISARVTELLAEREAIHRQATAQAVENVALTKEWILAQLIENVALAKQAGELGVINRSLELLGKELGMFVDRKEVRKGSLDGLNADDREHLREAIQSELAARDKSGRLN